MNKNFTRIEEGQNKNVVDVYEPLTGRKWWAFCIQI